MPPFNEPICAALAPTSLKSPFGTNSEDPKKKYSGKSKLLPSREKCPNVESKSIALIRLLSTFWMVICARFRDIWILEYLL